MTANRLARLPRASACLALLLTAATLQACSEKPAGQASSTLRVYAADVTGRARVCDAPEIAPTAGKTADITMKMDNDGGWCGTRAYQPGPKPFDAGLLTARPSHGTVLIHQVGDYTRIDFTPDRGYVGTDTFSVSLLPDSAKLNVTVTVTGPAPAKT
jgi:hypothetical protein